MGGSRLCVAGLAVCGMFGETLPSAAQPNTCSPHTALTHPPAHQDPCLHPGRV